MASHINDWYNNFLSKRCIPIKRQYPPETPNEGIAVVIRRLRLQKLNPSSLYRISAFFYDAKSAQMFGCPYQTAWHRPDQHECYIEDHLFFHCPMLDEDIKLILEIVEDDPDAREIHSVAWAMKSISAKLQPMAEYSHIPRGVDLEKLKLHPGSPKILTFSNFDPDATSLGVLECSMYSHPHLLDVMSLFPDYCIVGNQDDVPGVARNNDGPQLANPTLVPRVSASLDEIGLSFGPHAEKIEKLILDDLNSDRFYEVNPLPPRELTPMIILERRLRIGVHNGYSFMSEPLVVHLSSLDDVVRGTHSLRKKGRSLTRSSTDIRSEMNSLFVNSRISVPQVVEDDRIALVFALDYLVGVKSTVETAAHSQSVIIGWGAWKPFVDKHQLDSSGRVQASVAIIGGPRPNPEEILCFKNVLHLFRRDDSVFTESSPKITIQFNFCLDAHARLDSRISARETLNYDEPDRITPAPKKETIVAKLDDEDKVKDELEEEEKKHTLPPISSRKPILKSPRNYSQSIEKMIEQESPRENIPSTFSIPWKDTRVSNAPRSACAVIANAKFTPIIDRNGDLPVLVDIQASVVQNKQVEIHDRLDTNEIVFQFMAFRTLNQQDSVSCKKVFFTMQFYRFPQLTTEEMLLSPSSSSAEPSILMRLDSAGRLLDEHGVGFMAKYIIDRQATGRTDRDELVTFLTWNHANIEVWDAESLLPIGVALVPMKALLRGGREAVQCLIQCPVVSMCLPSEPRMVALLYLKIANVGHPSSNQIDMVCSRNTALVSRRLERLGQDGKETQRVRAKPLNATEDGTLHRFMQAQRVDIQQRYEDIFNEDTFDRLRQWERLKTAIPPSAHKKAFNKFMFEEELEAYRRLRNENKASKLLQTVFKGITLQHTIYPSLGECQFFEFLLQNSFPEPVNCIITIDEPGLSIVTDAEDWEFYKRNANLETPLEKNFCHSAGDGKMEVFLKPMEALHVPFLYDDFKAEKYQEGQITQTKVLFRRWDSGHPLAVLDLRIQHRPYALNQTLRFAHYSMTNFQKSIEINGLRENRRVGAVKCTDPTVKVHVRNQGTQQELGIMAYCGNPGTIQTFLVMFYGDRHGYRLLATWKLVIHSMERLDIRATMGQTAKIPVTVRRLDVSNELMQLYSTSPSVISSCHQPLLATSDIHQMEITYKPQSTGRRIDLLSAVNISSKKLLNAWIVHSRAEPPNITKQYNMSVPLREEALIVKRLPVLNPYSIPRTFRIISSRPDLVSIGDDVIDILPNQSVLITLYFNNVVRKAATVEVLIFVQNAETGQQEDTFAIHISYVE